LKLAGEWVRSIARTEGGVRILDQRKLPWMVEWVELTSAEACTRAIREMWTRGAPLIGAVAAYGLAMALRDNPLSLERSHAALLQARPTAINLRWALDQVRDHVRNLPLEERADAAFARADAICDEDVALNHAIGQHGLALLKQIHACNPDRPLNILTHCNPGWLATVDYGTATAPIYMAHDEGLPLHVWVDETRPRNQGALLTAFELSRHGVPHSVIADNVGGLLMQRGEVDLVIVGTDRVTANGDVCNKVGTYLKALAARDNSVPFYVALPYTTIDRALASGDEVPIEDRSGDELAWITGPTSEGHMATVRLTDSPVHNPAFDITPARLVTGYITERGVTATI
jgi:methylthioribose-1-phosphate isomerase